MASPADQAAELAKLPGLTPPEGIAPNFINPYSRQYLIVATTAITLTVVTLFVAIRTYTKLFIHKTGLGWDDYVSLLAWVGYVAYASVGVQVIHYGGFVHQWNVPAIKVMHFLQASLGTYDHRLPMETMADLRKIVNTLEILYGPVMFITKLSILLQLINIFSPARNGITYYLCHFMLWFNLIFYTAIMFAAIFVCSPRHKFWEPMVPGTCVNIDTVNIITSVINACSDLVLLLLPIVCVWQLQMSMRKKMGVSAVFATALFACTSSIMRIVTSVQVVGVQDVTWGILNEGLWALGEISSGIICGCMPTLPQFFRHFIPKITTALSSNSRKKTSESASTKYSDPPQNLKAASPDGFFELDEEAHQLKPFCSSGKGSRVRADEVPASEDEDGDGDEREVGPEDSISFAGRGR